MKHTPFLQEVLEQPQALLELVDRHQGEGFDSLCRARRLLDGASRVILTGMGTSYYAPLCVLDDFLKMGAIHLEAGELFEYHRGLITPDTVLVMISQSGESIEIKRLLEKLPEGCRVIGVTNDPASTLAAASDCPLLLYGGSERTITNRTFTNTLALLELLVCPKEERPALCGELREAAERMSRYLNDPQTVPAAERAAEALLPADHAYFIGRGGMGQVCALQSALIFTEGAHCAARGLTTGMFHHGPMEICDGNHRAVVFLQDDAYQAKTVTLCEQMRTHGSRVVAIGSPEPAGAVTMPLPRLKPRAFPYLAALAAELLLVAVAEKRGREAGQFAIGHKITSED